MTGNLGTTFDHLGFLVRLLLTGTVEHPVTDVCVASNGPNPQSC